MVNAIKLRMRLESTNFGEWNRQNHFSIFGQHKWVSINIFVVVPKISFSFSVEIIQITHFKRLIIPRVECRLSSDVSRLLMGLTFIVGLADGGADSFNCLIHRTEPSNIQRRIPVRRRKSGRDEWRNKLQLMRFTCVHYVIRSIDLLRSDEGGDVTYVRKRDHFCNIFFYLSLSLKRDPSDVKWLFLVKGSGHLHLGVCDFIQRGTKRRISEKNDEKWDIDDAIEWWRNWGTMKFLNRYHEWFDFIRIPTILENLSVKLMRQNIFRLQVISIKKYSKNRIILKSNNNLTKFVA